MKTKHLTKKLYLNKVTLSNLANRTMDSVRGGITARTCWETCYPKCNTVYTCEGCPAETDHYATCIPCIPWVVWSGRITRTFECWRYPLVSGGYYGVFHGIFHGIFRARQFSLIEICQLFFYFFLKTRERETWGDGMNTPAKFDKHWQYRTFWYNFPLNSKISTEEFPGTWKR